MKRLLIALALLATPLSLPACSCAAETVEKAFDAATHVFIARIAMRARRADTGQGRRDSLGRYARPAFPLHSR